jgi:hypothetical protein
MSTELDRTLERLYAALGDEAQVAPLAPAEELRRRGDRRTARRAVLAGAVAAVLVAGAAAGGSLLLAGAPLKVEPGPQPTTPQVTAAPTTPPSPTPSPGATSPASPSAGPSVSAAAGERPRPTAVPDAVFLSAEELNTTAPLSRPADRFLPSLCRRAPIDTGVAVRRTLSGYVNEPSAPVDSAPGAQLTQSIAVYEHPSDARSFLEGLGAAPSSCPTEPIATGTMRYRALTDARGVGSDAVLVQQQIPASDFVTGEPVPGTWTFYTAAVRHGDVVTVLYTYAYENWGLDEDPAFMVDLLRRAHGKIATWRGPVAATPGP